MQLSEWLSQNGAYMTLRECLAHDWDWLVPLLMLDLMITLFYFKVFWDAWQEYRSFKSESPMSNAFLSMAAVFVTCGVCGYLLDWVSVFVPAYKLKVLLMVPQLLAVMWLVYFMRYAKSYRAKYLAEFDRRRRDRRCKAECFMGPQEKHYVK